MRLFAIQKLTFLLGNPKIDLWHYLAFHGFRCDGANWRNSATKPKITCPELDFVVDPHMAELFARIKDVTLVPLPRVRAFEHEVREGDFTHWDTPGVVGTDAHFIRMLVEREVSHP